MSRQNLWAPWRISYLQQLADEPEKCFLCEASRADASDHQHASNLVLLCDERGVLLLNRYPYTNGHLLVAPLDHRGNLSDMNAAQRANLMELAELGSRALHLTSNPQGINLGMNLGRCAGAGVPGHAHMHIVPRWHGDVNFMEVVGGVRVIPQTLEQSYCTLRKAIKQLAAA